MTGIIIQSRLGSIRLLRKALFPIAGIPSILHTVERCLETGFPVILAVPDGEGQEFRDATGNICPIFEGHPTDVLDRYYECAKAFKFDPIVRITGDCPLVDPNMIKAMVENCVCESCEKECLPDGRLFYYSNAHPIRTVPKGLDIEIFSFASLELAKEKAIGNQREHVTKYFYEEVPEICISYSPPFPDSWTICIDTQEDYERVKAMIEEGKYPWLN